MNVRRLETGVQEFRSQETGARRKLPSPELLSPDSSQADRLRATARQLEGVFVEQMFKAMRETVPEGGALSGGSGEEMFTGMLDQSLSAEVPERWSNGLAEALYRQLQRAAGIAEAAPGASAPPDASSPSPAVPILDPGTSTGAAPARALLAERQ